jgi:copper chaperone CopZ
MKKTVLMIGAVLFAMTALADNVMFSITNMHCGNCAKRVESVLKANEAVSQVSVNLDDKTVCVSYDARKTSAEALQQALKEANFQAEEAQACQAQCQAKGGEADHQCGQKAAQTGDHKCGAEGCAHAGSAQE